MASLLIGAVSSLFGGGAAAAPIAAGIAGPWGASLGAGAAAGAAATTAATGISLTGILQGMATALGIATTLAGASADADQMEAAAIDAERESDLENLQGVQRRASIRREMADALAAQDVAYAASNVDLSFGTAAAARKDALREGDLATAMDAGTQMTRQSRLSERAANYRAGAKRARRMGFLNAALGAVNSYI